VPSGDTPSIVTTGLPIAVAAGMLHERTARPSTCTVQAPHCPMAAAEFRARQADVIAYDPQQGRLRIGIDAVYAPFDDQVERHAFVLRVGEL
jgi:hypothetical protein